MANFGERWAAARTRLPKAAPGFASVIRNSQVQNGEVRDALLHVSDHGTPPDEATPDGTIPYRFNFLTQRPIADLAPSGCRPTGKANGPITQWSWAGGILTRAVRNRPNRTWVEARNRVGRV
jgi:hypothetical protein